MLFRSIGESDYFLSHKRTPEECEKHISSLVSDLKNMNSRINSLLELAQIGRNKNIIFSDARIDEIVFTAIQQTKEKFKDRKILPKIQYPENDNELLISGNTGLLEIAFRNLIENAWKFSDKDVIVEFMIDDDFVIIRISDYGIGIPSDELESIRLPFKRASNAKFTGGFGIGLSLVTRIMEIHNAGLTVSSKIGRAHV